MARSSPRVILSAAISLDGKIATRSGDSALSSGVDKKRLHKLRTQVDAILVGKNTILQDNPMLNVRYAKGKSPIRIVLDSLGQTPTNSKIIQTSDEIQTIVAVSEKIPKKNLDKLAKFPLGHAKIKTILLEGGGTTNWDFVNQGLVDQVIVTITPYLVGGKDAKTLVDGDGFAKISKSLRLNLDKIVHQGNEIVLYYS
ncbi:MAG: 2,5-diamino-6-(ribosylamino)-4(3H)-pyrimidinone 5'-phosphate reductase [Nitrososphaeria archaeon]|nr:2,5-diamino-6-(ribosylamino)-4(3H)-pyrimidinone 5'-phosphate reductase [Nitrososphaeria archaeon]